MRLRHHRCAELATYTTRTTAAAATAGAGLPRPMVNPRVPSGILGPCAAACRGLAARLLSKCPGAPAACAEECGVCGGLQPRPLPHGFLAPTCWSSSCCCQGAHQLAAEMVRQTYSKCQGVVACPLTLWSGKCAAAVESDETRDRSARSSSEAARWSSSGRFIRVAVLGCGDLNGRRHHVRLVISSGF